MTGLTARTRNLTVRFGDVTAVDGLDLRLAAGKIHGLLGRNGSGKSTLAAVLAGFRRPTAGSVLIEGDFGAARAPYEDAVVTSRICLIRESGDVVETASVRGMVNFARGLRTLRGRGTALVGPARAVDEVTAGLTVLAEQRLGATKSATVLADLDDGFRARAHDAGLQRGPVGCRNCSST